MSDIFGFLLPANFILKEGKFTCSKSALIENKIIHRPLKNPVTREKERLTHTLPIPPMETILIQFLRSSIHRIFSKDAF